MPRQRPVEHDGDLPPENDAERVATTSKRGARVTVRPRRPGDITGLSLVQAVDYVGALQGDVKSQATWRLIRAMAARIEEQEALLRGSLP